MELTRRDFQLFDRSSYAFKQLKAVLTEKEITAVKAEYKERWEKWRALQLAVFPLLPPEMDQGRPKIESWTNGWNLRSHFWAAYRSRSRQQENACLAVLMNKKQYQVYLMFQHYRSDERAGSIADYNHLLALLPQWSRGIDPADYYIWPQSEDELADHLPLVRYLEDEKARQKLHEAIGEGSFQIGKLFFADEPLSASEAVTATALQELAPLYQAAAAESDQA